MFSEEKIKQVFNAIKENGIDAFDDEALAKLLSILSFEELDVFERKVYDELEGMEALMRIFHIRPFVNTLINEELYRIRKSSIYEFYIEALKKGQYRDFFKTLKVDELADLKKYISYTTKENDSNKLAISGAKKIIQIITQEIKSKEEMRKPHFETM